jgi:hypothetical protein
MRLRPPLFRSAMRGSGFAAAILALMATVCSLSLANETERSVTKPPAKKQREGNPARSETQVVDLDGRPIDPLRVDAGTTVLIFVSIDCPISNRYAPEVRRLWEKFAERNVTFWLVYADPEASAPAIREHLKAFQYPFGALRDPKHQLVKTAKARVTPESAVFATDARLLYHGRIDDWYVDFGKARPAATSHDLRDAIEAALTGRAPVRASAAAVGCRIPDLP